jgi:hypothetical protein
MITIGSIVTVQSHPVDPNTDARCRANGCKAGEAVVIGLYRRYMGGNVWRVRLHCGAEGIIDSHCMTELR